ncbi:MAG: hypothetical protein SFV81_10855 [Pirellulaceae bacterium]|nr:hypothetical protein [Pirellulaceae bacterium]
MNLATATDLALEEETHATQASESFAADVTGLSNLIADCVRSTDCFLSDPINRGKAGRFRISGITVGLLALNVSLTIVLNMSMLNAGATVVQLLIGNAGLMVLHLLASICIASDLARGKTHFLNERTHLARQFHELSDQLTDIVQERQKWVDALNRCKWSMDAERLKVQLATQELQSLEDKLVSVNALIDENQKQLVTLQSQQATAKLELQKSIADKEAALVERSQLQTDSERLRHAVTELNAEIEQAQATKQARQAEIASIEVDFQALVTKRTAKDDELATLQLELESASDKLAAQEAQQLSSLAEFESKIAQLTSQRSDLDAAIQASTQTYDDLQATIKQAQVQLASTSAEHKQLLSEIETTVAAADATLLTQQQQIAERQSTLDAMAESRSAIEAELAKARDLLKDLNTKAEYAQLCNVQLVNESITLELKGNQVRESIAGAEAELERIQSLIEEGSATLQTLYAEEVATKSRIADLAQTVDAQAALEILAEEKTHLELQISQGREDLQQIATQRELAIQKNLQLANEASDHEVKTNQHREMLTQVEAELESMQCELAKRKSALAALQSEELKLELRVANLLTQAGKFDCLAVATSETYSFAQEQQRTEQAICVAALQDQKAQLETSMRELQIQLESEKATAEKLTEEASKIHADAAKSIEDAERRVEMLTEKADTLAEQVQARSSELFAIKQEMIDLRAEVRDLEATNLELKEVEQELEGLKTQLADHRAQTTAVSAQIAEAEALYQTRQQAADAIREQITTLEGQLQLATGRFDSHTRAVEQLQIEQDALVSQNQELSEQKADLEFAILQSRNTKQETTHELEELRELAKSQREQISQLESERSAIECDVADLTSSLQLLLAERNQLQSEADQLQDLIAQRSGLEEEIENLSANIDSLKQQQAAAIELISLHEKAAQEQAQQVSTLQGELTELEQQQADLIAANAQSSQELATTLQAQHSAAEQYNATTQETETLKSSLSALRSQVDLLNKQHASATATLQRAIDEVNDAQAVAKQWATYIDSLKVEVESQRKVQSEVQRSVVALRESESQAMIDMERATREVQSLLEQQAYLKTSNQREELALSAAQQANQELHEQREELRNELLDIQKMLAEVTSQLTFTNAELQKAEANVEMVINNQAELENQILERQATLERLVSDHQSHQSRVQELGDEQQFLENTLCGLNKQVTLAESVIASLETRKHDFELELREQENSIAIAGEQLAAIKSEVARLKVETAALQSMELELAKIESECHERTRTLNALCEESALEQSRLNELKAQIPAAQQMLDELLNQKTISEAAHAQLENDIYSMKQALAQAGEELLDQINAKETVTKLIADFNLEIQRFGVEKAAVEHEINQLSEQLHSKLVALQGTEDKISSAEAKALDLWSTISELQALRTELDNTLCAKRDAIAQANTEISTFDELRNERLSECASIEMEIAGLKTHLREYQESKRVLDQEISVLTAEVQRMQAEAECATAELESIALKIPENATNESELYAGEMQNMSSVAIVPQAAVQETIVQEIVDPVQSESEVDSAAAYKPIKPASSPSQEEDIWSSLGEIARMGRIVRSEAARSTDVPMSSVPMHAETGPESEKLAADEWELVFTPKNNYQRA